MLPSAPRNGDGDQRAHTEAERAERADHLTQHRPVHHGIAHDAALPDAGAPGFELRLHEQHELGIGGGERQQVGRDGAQRDERQIGDAQIGRRIDRARLELAHVRAFHHGDAFVVAQRPRELPRPTSIATTWAAPRRSRQSVNPPVDAPTSSAPVP